MTTLYLPSRVDKALKRQKRQVAIKPTEKQMAEIIDALQAFASIPISNIQYGKIWTAIDPEAIAKAREVLAYFKPEQIQPF